MGFGVAESLEISDSDTRDHRKTRWLWYFGKKPGIFSLLDARAEVAARANDDITLVCEIKDGEERAER